MAKESVTKPSVTEGNRDQASVLYGLAKQLANPWKTFRETRAHSYPLKIFREKRERILHDCKTA